MIKGPEAPLETLRMIAMRMHNPRCLRVNIRPMVRQDIDAIMEIDSAGNPFPWSRDDFAAFFRGVVGEADNEFPPLTYVAELAVQPTYLVGFLVYHSDIRTSLIHICNIGVHPSCRRRRVGSQMLAHLMSRKDNRRVEAIMPERALEGQLWLRAMEFRAESIVHQAFGGVGGIDGDVEAEDGYLFVHCPERNEGETRRVTEGSLMGDSGS